MGDFKISASSPEKQQHFQRVFGKLEVEIASPHPINASTPEGPKQIYEVAPAELTEEVKQRYLELVCEKRGITTEEGRKRARVAVENAGYVIDGEGCIVSIENPQRWA